MTDAARGSVVARVRRTLAAPAIAPRRGSTLLLAVSGGADSQALLAVMAALAPELDLRLVAVGVDHGLRPAAARELDLAEAQARALGVAFERSSVDVGAGSNLQERARDARRDALFTAAARVGAELIATGHHRDDRAETVLLQLLRGARSVGLAALPPRDGPFLRPLVDLSRAEIEAFLRARRIAWAVDPSNLDPRHLRVRVRSEALPALERLARGATGHLADLGAGGAAPLPAVVGPAGEPLWLGRAQRDALRALVDAGRPGELWLTGGFLLRVPVPAGDRLVAEVPAEGRRAPRAPAAAGVEAPARGARARRGDAGGSRS